MKPSRALILLSILTALLALAQSGAGLFWPAGGGAPFSFTTLHGETVQIYGQGLYYYDTYFKAPIFRGTDAATFFLAVPLLGVAIWFARKGSLRGTLFLAAVQSYFIYNAISVAFGTAYNNLFLLYIVYFSASLFSFGLAVSAIDMRDLAARLTSALQKGLPRRGIAALLFVAGAALLFAWLTDLINWMLPGALPGITSYTTEITYAVDLGVIMPLCFLAGVLVLRRNPQGYRMALVLLFMLPIIAVVLVSQTLFQASAGIILPLGVFIGKDGSFILLGVFSLWLFIRTFRGIAAPGRVVTNRR